MDRETAREYIKQNISCTDYLLKAPNYSQHNETGYCCPHCDSGTHGTKDSDGAVKYYADTNTWYCHACGTGGDVIDAYREQNRTDYNTALTELAARAGVTIDKSTERPQSDYKRADDRQPQKYEKDAHRGEQGPAADYTAYYQACRAMLHDPAAVNYLQARGISTETAERCGIGFDPAADPAAAPGATTDAGKRHPTPRIIAPCTADYYANRSMGPNTPTKYKSINPTGSHTQLFNAAAIYSNDVVFVVEGFIDALSFIEAGAAAIALNGKGNGPLLLKQLQERPTHTSFIICHDNDNDDPEKAADTMRRANELNDALQAMDYKSIVYNVAGIYHDANDALQNDRPNFERAMQAAVEELRRDDLTDFLEKIQTEAYKPYKTGLRFFDDLLGGGIIQQSLLLLLAAPGTGKTTLVQQIAETMAKERKPVLYINFEMSKEQMIAKAISARLYKSGTAKTALDVLQGYSWTEQENKAITKAIQEYRAESYPYITYNPAGASSEINSLLAYLTAIGEKAKADGQPAPAVVIDYLHLIRGDGKQDVQELIKQAVTGLKEYAVKYNTFVIGIVATNRATNKSGKITLESGRDSSNLEYTADYQISLNYYAVDNGAIAPDDVDGIADLQKSKRRAMILRVLKNRFSQPGRSAQIMFDAAHNLFYGMYDDYTPADGFTLDDGTQAF